MNESFVHGRIYAFDTDRSELLPKHRAWLTTRVVPLLEGGGSVTIVGEADRTGSEAHNVGLSQQRAAAVEAFLRGTLGSAFRSGSVLALHGAGETPAARAGSRDGQPDPWHRSVRVIAWRRPSPPPPQRTPAPQPATPDLRTPRGFFAHEIRWTRGLAQAWALSIGRRWDRGGPSSRVFPEREDFLAAMMAQGYTSSEAMQMWLWYEEVHRGEPGPGGGQAVVSGSSERIRQLEEAMRDAPGGSYDPPWRSYRPNYGFAPRPDHVRRELLRE